MDKSVLVATVATMISLVSAVSAGTVCNWSGTAGDGLWSSPWNWEGAPAAGDTVAFNTSGGGSLKDDVADLSLAQIVFGSQAGAFTIGGWALSTVNGIESASSAEQVFSNRLAFGVDGADETVTIDIEGAVSLAGGTDYLGDKLVKKGNGTLTTTEGLLYGAQHIVVEKGTLKLDQNRPRNYEVDPRYYPDTLSKDANNMTRLWRNTKLSDVARVSAQVASTDMNQTSPLLSYYWNNNGSTATVQFQQVDGKFIKVVCVTFKQVGDDVYAYVNRAARNTGNGEQYLGRDYSSGWTQETISDPLATSGGYNVRDVRPYLVAEDETRYPAVTLENDRSRVLVWRSTKLEDVDGAVAIGNGDWGFTYANPYFWSNDGTTATVQFQQDLGASGTKCQIVTLTQVGADVYATGRGVLSQGKSVVGTDMSSGYANQPNYKVKDLYPVYRSVYANNSRFYPGGLSKDASNMTRLWRNTKLSDVARVSAQVASTDMNQTSPLLSYYWNNNGSTATVQFQQVDGNFIKVVCVTFKQVGDDVYAYVNRAARNTGNGEQYLGRDYSSGWTQETISDPLATSGGYNVRDVRPHLTSDDTARYPNVTLANDVEPVLVWRNTNLEDVDGAVAIGNGDWGFTYANPYFWSNDGTTATVQFQQDQGASGTRCQIVTLTQVGADVYATGRGVLSRNASVVGTDMSSGYENQPNYKVKDLYPVYRSVPECDAATLTVKDGARLDVNQKATAVHPLKLTEMVHGKVVYVEGDGPDGDGALYNSDLTARMAKTFGRIVLTGDTKVGGGCMELRALNFSAVGARDGEPLLKGPFAFTVDCSRFNFLNSAFNVGKVVSVKGLQIQGTATGTVTEGIHLASAENLNLAGATLAAGIPVVVDSGVAANITAYNGSNAINGPFTVEAGATIAVTATKQLTLKGPVSIAGELTASGAENVVIASAFGGSGSVGGKVVFAGDNSCWRLRANADGLVSALDLSGLVSANGDALKQLRKIEVVFDTLPDQSSIWEKFLAPAGNLTDNDLNNISVAATDAQGTPLTDVRLKLSDGSLILAANDDTIPVVAYWTGNGDGSDPADPRNWACTNICGDEVAGVLPTADTTVYLTAGRVFNCTNGAPLACREIVLPESFSLVGDCDWRGLNVEKIAEGGCIDLHGCDLLLALTADPVNELTVTDSSAAGAGGELHLEIASGKTVRNEVIALRGSLKLVKDGAGTFTAAKTGQTYTGGTEITAGVANIPASPNDGMNYAGTTGIFGAIGSEITVRAGSTLDICGNYAFNVYRTLLDGGTYRNSVEQTNNSADSSGNITLLADSQMDIAAGTYFNSTDNVRKVIELGGHKLTVSIAGGKACNISATGCFANGLVDLSGGWFKFYDNGGEAKICDMRTVDLRLNCAFLPGLEANLRNVETVRKGSRGGGDTLVHIYGTYTPGNGTRGHFEMMDGSTIDLRSQTSLPWDSMADRDNQPTPLEFAANAKVFVNISGLTVPTNNKVMGWDVKPTLEHVTFRVVDATGSYANHRLVKMDDGAYLSPGMMITVR